MFSDSNFDSADSRGFDAADGFGPQPLRIPPLSQESTGASGSFMSDLYAAAWTMARRDHEIDRLFNADFYQADEH